MKSVAFQYEGINHISNSIVNLPLQQLRENIKKNYKSLKGKDAAGIAFSYEDPAKNKILIRTEQDYAKIIAYIKQKSLEIITLSILYIEDEDSQGTIPSNDDEDEEKEEEDEFDSNKEVKGSDNEQDMEQQLRIAKVKPSKEEGEQEEGQNEQQEAAVPPNVFDSNSKPSQQKSEEENQEEANENQESSQDSEDHEGYESSDDDSESEDQKIDPAKPQREQQLKNKSEPKPKSESPQENDGSDSSDSSGQQQSEQSNEEQPIEVEPMSDSGAQDLEEDSPDHNEAKENSEEGNHQKSSQAPIQQLSTNKKPNKQESIPLSEEPKIVEISSEIKMLNFENKEISEIKKPAAESSNESENRNDEQLLEKVLKTEQMLLDMQKLMTAMQERLELLEKGRELQPAQLVLTGCNGCGLLKNKGSQKKVGNTTLNIFFCVDCDLLYDISQKAKKR